MAARHLPPPRKILTPQECGLPPKFDSWRHNQEGIVDLIITSEKRVSAICAPTGAGKSPAYVAAAILTGKPTAVVTSSRALQDQLLDDFSSIGMVDLRGRSNYKCDMRPEDPDYTCEEGYAARCPYKGTVACACSQAEMRAASSSLVVTNYAKWTSARKFGQGLSHIEQVIFDEGHCFVAGTFIETYTFCQFPPVPIENIKVGTEVTSFDECSPVYLPIRKVTRVFKRTVTSGKLLRLSFSDGSSIVCTPEHPFYTNQGWIKANNIGGSVLCLKHGTYNRELCSLQQGVSADRSPEEVRSAQVREGLLWPLVCIQTDSTFDVPGEPGDAQTEDVTPQSYVGPDKQGCDESHYSGHETSASTPGREWQRRDSSAEVISLGLGVGYGGCCGHGDMASRSGQELQTGCGKQEPESGNRSRWQKPHQVQESKEGYGSYWVRLDSVEVYESTDRQRFESVCPDGAVYNLEIETNHAYLANGFVVHNCCPEALADAMQVTLHHREIVEGLKIDFPDYQDAQEFANWKVWARSARVAAELAMVAAQARIQGLASPKPSWVKHYTHMRNLLRRLGILSTAGVQDWIVDEVEDGYQFDPISPGRYAESALLLKVPRIIIVSATLRPKTLFMTGIGRGSFDFTEFDSDFDPRRCPIYYIPTMRVDSRSTDFSMLWVKLDQIAAKRRDRKGIVHTVSYTRQQEIMAASRFASSMIINEKGEPSSEKIEEFRAAGPGAILVSPSVGAGYDFKDDACRFQFVCKIPFKPPSKIVKAREALDKEYRSYEAMQSLVQTFGRGVRSKEDWCESFICDENLQWFLPHYGHLAPKSFHSFFRTVNVVPPPPQNM